MHPPLFLGGCLQEFFFIRTGGVLGLYQLLVGNPHSSPFNPTKFQQTPVNPIKSHQIPLNPKKFPLNQSGFAKIFFHLRLRKLRWQVASRNCGYDKFLRQDGLGTWDGLPCLTLFTKARGQVWVHSDFSLQPPQSFQSILKRCWSVGSGNPIMFPGSPGRGMKFEANSLQREAVRIPKEMVGFLQIH